MHFQFKNVRFNIFCQVHPLTILSQFEIAFYCYHRQIGESLYNPRAMKEFAETHVPGLFDMFLKSIKRDDQKLSCDREVYICNEQFHCYTFLVISGKAKIKV